MGRPAGSTTRRRALLAATLAVGAIALPAARGQSLPTIGILLFRPLGSDSRDGFLQGLRDHGYVEGRNIRIEWRSAEGQADRAEALARELVALGVQVIVAEFTPCVRAARSATSTIPIVMAPAGDPVATGLVKSLSRPGGNITGLSNIAAELSGKRFELLRQVVPGLGRAALLQHGADPIDRAFLAETRRAAASSGVGLVVAEVHHADELRDALGRLKAAPVQALIVPGNLPVRDETVAQAALDHRLPSISPLGPYADAGGLLAYGANVPDLQRRALDHVERLLKGARASDLPVETPTRFELVINVRTARTLGIAIPSAVLLRADRVVG